MKRIFKIIGIGIFCTLVVVFIAAAVLFVNLPSPHEIGKALTGKGKTSGTAPSVSAAQTHQSVNEGDGKSRSEPIEASTANDNQVGDEQKSNLDAKNDQDLALIENLMDPHQEKSQVCNHLDQALMIPPGLVYSEKQLGEQFRRSLNKSVDKKDPAIQALLAPMRFFIQQPKMGDLLATVTQAARTSTSDSIMEKAEFYSKVYEAYNEMLASKTAAEELMDREYLLIMLTKAVHLKPDLLEDPKLKSYCDLIERSINSDTELNHTEEKNEFQNFLLQLGVDPKSIGYDPKYKTTLEFKKSAKGLQFHGGWIDSMLGGRPK